MPCRSDYPEDYAYSRVEVDKITRMLCETISYFSSRGTAWMSKELRHWWEDHQEADRKRLAADAEKVKQRRRRNEALSKLTHEEIKLLGLI